MNRVLIWKSELSVVINIVVNPFDADSASLFRSGDWHGEFDEASFFVGFASPDAVFVAVPQGVVQTLLTDGGGFADCFRFPDF